MKRKAAITAAILSAALIAGLIGLGIYLTASNQRTKKSADDSLTLTAERIADELSDALSDDGKQTEAASEDENETENAPAENNWFPEQTGGEDTPVIWLGDSRTVGLQEAVEDYSEDVFIGASGEGYEWLSETGVPLLERAIDEHPGWPVVCNMGVNDYENITNYLDLYENLCTLYPDVVFYFLSVNPVDDERSQSVSNENINWFNEQIKAVYPDTYIDSYSYLLGNQIETEDGVHYSSEGYREIYLLVKNTLASA